MISGAEIYDNLPSLSATESAAPVPRATVLLPLVMGLVWGGVTGFSFYFEFASPDVIQGIGLTVAAVLMTATSIAWIVRWGKNTFGIMMLLHAAVAIASGLSSDSATTAILRYCLLLPSAAMLIEIVRLGQPSTHGIRIGFTAMAYVFVLYHMAFVNLSEITDPNYRFYLFLNANGVAFVSAMCALSFLDYALSRLKSGATFPAVVAAVLLLLAIIPCLYLLVATKSRTGTFAFIFGALVRLYLSLGFKRTLIIAVVSTVFFLTTGVAFVAGFGERFAEIFDFTNKYRDIFTATGRFEGQGQFIQHVWLPNFFLGVGPGNQGEIGASWTTMSSPHNGILMDLCEVGLLGTLPLVFVVLSCCRRSIQVLAKPEYHWAIALFAAGMLESGAETLFFSMGNPGSLLFLLAIAQLCDRRHSGSPSEAIRN